MTTLAATIVCIALAPFALYVAFMAIANVLALPLLLVIKLFN